MVSAAGAQVGADNQTFGPIDHLSVTLAVSGTSAARTLTFPNLRTSAQPTVRLYNNGADLIYVRFSRDSAVVATKPSGGTPGDMALAVGAIETFPVSPNSDGTFYIAAISDSSTATLHIAPGYGA